MRTIFFNIPDTIDLTDREARMILASKLYERGKFTFGQAAEMTGLSKIAFMELLADYDISIFNYHADEIEKDALNAKNYCI